MNQRLVHQWVPSHYDIYSKALLRYLSLVPLTNRLISLFERALNWFNQINLECRTGAVPVGFSARLTNMLISLFERALICFNQIILVCRTIL
ncbi:hypothetical protein CEXT_161761 [Caerostris extrusa]|uniref:Maturase K n=1 Tax=Caerostris extrusa TaxID=172846 RepID=A0AAV4RS45_CAEEX|nr:hypothetical protein CEXT_161761 [Caerostris extrusa]